MLSANLLLLHMHDIQLYVSLRLDKLTILYNWLPAVNNWVAHKLNSDKTEVLIITK